MAGGYGLVPGVASWSKTWRRSRRLTRAQVVPAAQVLTSQRLRGNLHGRGWEILYGPLGTGSRSHPELGEGDSSDGDTGAGKWFPWRWGLGQVGEPELPSGLNLAPGTLAAADGQNGECCR